MLSCGNNPTVQGYSVSQSFTYSAPLLPSLGKNEEAKSATKESATEPASQKRKFRILSTQEKKKLRKEISDLEEIQHLEKRRHVQHNPLNTIKLLEAKLRDMESAYQSTKDLLHKSRATADLAQAQLQSKEECIVKLEKELEEFAQVDGKQHEEIKELTRTCQDQEKKLQQAEALLDMRLSHMADLEIKLQKKQSETEKKQQEIASLQIGLKEEQAQKEQVQARYMEVYHYLQQKQSELLQALREKEEAERLLQIEQHQNKQLDTSLASSKETIEALEKTINEKERQVEQLKDMLASHEKCIKSIQNAMGELFSTRSNH